MKINKLTFKNINSLKGIHTIEFNKPPLSETGIFAITGAVGSGKSTILDVITLALFNKTPRFTGGSGLNSSVISYHGAIITRNTNECFAEIEYQVKADLYRSKWSISRNRNGKLRDYEMEITHINKENALFDLKKREVPDKNAEIIGLNYEQFVKSIILSQGEFSKFLKAGESERSELLEKITGVDIYRKLGRACFDRNKIENEKLAILQAKSGIIEVLSDAILLQLNEKINSFKIINENIQNSENKLVKQISIKKNIEIYSAEKENIEKNLISNNQKIDLFKNKQIKLEQHEKLSVFQDSFSDLKHTNNQLIKTSTEIENSTINLDDSLNEKTLIAEKETHIKKKIEILCTELSSKEPVFEEVDKLDKEIGLKTERNSNLSGQFVSKVNSFKEKEKEISAIQQELHSLYNRYNKINVFLKESVTLKDLPKELGSINEYTKSFKEYRNEFQDIQKTNKIDFLKEKGLNSEYIYTKLRVELENLQAKITEISKETSFSESEIAKIQENIHKLRNKFKALEQIKTSFSKLETFEVSISKMKTQNGFQENEISIFEQKINDKIKETELLNKYIEELKAREERQQLEKNYEKGREKLKENTNCPLCGSIHHPFVVNYKNELSITKKRLLEKEKQLQATSKSIMNFEKEIIKSKSLLQANKNSIIEKSDLLKLEQNLITEVKKEFNFSFLSVKEIDEKKQEITQEGVDLGKNLKLLLQLQSFNLRKNKLVFLFEKAKIVHQTEQKIIDFKNKYADFIKKETESDKTYLILKGFSDKYELEEKNSIKLKNSTNESEKILKIKKEDFELVKKEKTELASIFNQSKESLKKIQQNRNELFGTKNPKNEAKKLNTQIKNNSEIHQGLSNELASLDAKISAIQGNLLSLNSSLEKNSKIKSKMEENLLTELQRIGFFDIKNAKQAILSSETVKKIKAEKEIINSNSIRLKQSLKDKTEDLKQQENDNDKSISLKQLELKIAENSENLKQNTKEIGVIANKLETDKKNRQIVSKIIQDIDNQQKETDKWGKLSLIIGDAKGKKFTDYAQKLTLMQLFVLANKHLSLLDGRYLIDNENITKDIFVLDSYQGNVARSVKTLSGGESFLVSLALALGLSDLAGRDTQINSLFIDEGFGSLDQQSLDTALSALEKLQSETNKTIGIISHVSSLKERIQTQIELKKSNSAYSTLFIKW